MRKLNRFLIPMLLLTALALAACGSTGDDDDDDTTSSPTPSSTGTPEPTFTWIQANVLPRCSGPACHGSGSVAPMTGYNDIVSVNVENTTGGCSAADLRVDPGSSGTSYFFIKLTATPGCGSRMPLSAQPLSAAEQTAVSDWIDSGAPNN